MINDAGRNHAFANALKSILAEKSKEKSNSVLDLGSGTGLLGIAAAKLGSRASLFLEIYFIDRC